MCGCGFVYSPDSKNLGALERPDTADLPWSPIPDGTATATVSILDGGYVTMPLGSLIAGESKEVKIPVFSFLIENKGNGRSIVLDLGIKTDPYKYAANCVAAFKTYVPTPPPKSIAQQLEAGGVDMTKIDDVIYSHQHWDHVGDLSHFPSSVGLICGPGGVELARPGYPADPKSSFNTDDTPISGRRVVELTKEQFNVQVGAFPGFDYWGDGSVFILDAPGHLPGHLAVAVRTTASPPTYMVLAADAAGHRALFSNLYDNPPKCGLFPGPIVVNEEGKETRPLMAMHRDLVAGYKTIASLRRMEEEDNVVVIIGHDIPMWGILDSAKAWWPQNVNDWKEKGWKEEMNKLSAP